MARQTSIDCYNQIKSEGLLSKRRLEVYGAILKSAPCTSAEAMAKILTANNVLSQSRARFTELRDRGVIKETGTRKCRVTGRTAIEWDLTDNLPIEPVKIIKTTKPRSKDILLSLVELDKKIDDIFIQTELREIINQIKELQSP